MVSVSHIFFKNGFNELPKCIKSLQLLFKNLKLQCQFCETEVGGDIYLSELRGGAQGRGGNTRTGCVLFKPICFFV